MLTQNLPTPEAMENFGQQLGKTMGAPLIAYMSGELGAGKTTLIRGILHGLGHTGSVKSPTYTIIEPYRLQTTVIYHIDLYRINQAQELMYLSLDDYFHEQSICLIEWPERGDDFLPEADLHCQLEYTDPGRNITITANTATGQDVIAGASK